MSVFLPNIGQSLVGPNGKADAYWYRWAQSVTDAVNAIPDGQAPDPDTTPTVSLVQGHGIAVIGAGTQDSPWVVRLRDLRDAGGGSFKLLTRDAQGRVSGTSDGSAGDVPYDNTTSGLAADDVQAALDELAAEKLGDAPNDGTGYVRKDGAWTAETGGGGGAGAYLDPATYLIDPMHDFLGKPPTGILEEVGASYPWVSGSIGSGGSISSVNGGADAPGVWRLNCGTTASGVTYISLGAVPNITLGAGVVRIPFRFRAPTLSTGTDRFQYNIGLRQSWGAAPTERIVLRYDHSLNSGKIDLLVTVGGVTTTVNGSTTVAANTWVSGYFEISADGSEVDLYVNGALEASANSGLPTGAMAVGAQINKVAGTSSRDLDLDYLGPVQIEFSTPR